MHTVCDMGTVRVLQATPGFDQVAPPPSESSVGEASGVPQPWVEILAALRRERPPSLINHGSSLGVARERSS